MSGSLIQRSFAAGEIAVDLYARADQTKYQTGLKQCRNFQVMRHGGVTSRTGSGLVQESKDSNARAYFIKFVFNADQTYVIEVGNLYMRFYRNGARIVVAGVAAYNGATTYAIGALVVQGGVNYYCVAATTGNAPPNATYWYPLTGAIYEIPTPYITADLADLRTVQSDDVITITHPSYRPRELRRTGHTAWTLPVISTLPGIDAPANTAVPVFTAGALPYSYVVTAIKAETYEESLPSIAATIACLTPSALAANGVTWDGVIGAIEYDVYLDAVGNGVYGYIGTASGAAFNDIGYTPDLSQTPPVDKDLFNAVDEYPAVGAYFQQRQMFAAPNNDPTKAWGSKTGAFKNFTVSSPIQDDDAVSFRMAGRNVNEIRHMIEVGDLIILTAGGEWLISGEEAMTPFPGGIHPKQESYYGAAKVPPVIIGNSLIYTQARQSIIRDLRFDVQADGYVGRDLTIFSAHLFEGYTIDRMDYAQNPHSIVWMVRSDGSLVGVTYLREQEVLGWHVHDTDGVYEDVCVVPEGTEDVVYVLVRRTINGNTRRYIERFASRRVTNIRTDALFMDSYLSYDGRNTDPALTMGLTSGGGFTSTDLLTITASAGFFVAGDVGNAIAFLNDDASEIFRIVIDAYTSPTVVSGYPNRDVTAFDPAVWARAVDQVSGLDHLEAKSVKILADGNVVADAVVASGVVTLDRPASIIHVGLGYVPTLETLDLDIAGQQIRDSKKKVKAISILVKESRGGFVGPDLDNLVEFKADAPEDFDDLPPLFTGLVDVNISGTWEETGRFMFIQVDPLPVTILAAIPTGDIGG